MSQKNKKLTSIPRQLILLVGLASAAVVIAGGVHYFTAQRAFKKSMAMTVDTVKQLDRSYDLLARISGDLNSLQQLLRLDDPDAIDKGIKDLADSQKKSAGIISECGAAGAGVKTQFETLKVQEKEAVDQFLKGQNALAYEKFLRGVTPQSSLLLEEIRKYHQNIQDAAQQQMLVQQVQMQKELRWWSVLLGGILVVVLYGGWLLKNRITRELLDIATTLAKVSETSASAADQVSSSSQSLAEGASEQAASIEETSASLEEMSSMTKRNAENAQKANDLAKQARSAADKGAEDMQQMNAAMQAIKASSDDISKIIKTIDEIAFQTNILALNAAVEAARAGEAGMGFAVVADEVRNLAQRSAQAAKETSTMIEGAISKTEQGVVLSRKVAEMINDILAKVRQVDELAAEVAGSSKEQAAGITQINTAVAQMDRVTQGNAASAEESAAAAEELNGQAEILKQSVTELVKLVGGRAGQSPAKSDAHSSGAVKARSVKSNVSALPGKANSHRQPVAAALSGNKRQMSEIPLEGDFKDF